MIEAVLFELGGALVRLEALDALAYAQAARELRGDLPLALVASYCRRWSGLSRYELASRLVWQFNLQGPAAARQVELAATTPWQALLRLRARAFAQLIVSRPLVRAEAWPHHRALLHTARMMGCRIALLAPIPALQLHEVLAALGLAESFDLALACEDTDHGPGDPDMHLGIAHALGATPSNCLIVTSAAAAARAALAAGMIVLAASSPASHGRFADLEPSPRCSVAEPIELLPELLYAAIAAHWPAAAIEAI